MTRAVREPWSRPFRLLCLGQFVSRIGRQITAVAAPYQVYQISHSALAIAILALVPVVPFFVGSTFGGQLADRVDRRRILIFTQYPLALASALLAAVTMTGRASLVVIYLVVGVAAAALAVESPTRHAVVPNLAPREHMAAALSLDFALFQASIVIGPAIAGVVIARAGLPAAYALDAASFVAALLVAVALPPQPPQPPSGDRRAGLWSSIGNGLRMVATSRVLVGTFVFESLAAFAIPRSLFPVLAATAFHVGPAGLGLMYAAPSVGGALVAFSSARWLPAVRPLGRLLIVSACGWAALVIVLGVTKVLWVALLCLAFAGAADAIAALCRSVIRATITPDSFRGRVSALDSVCSNLTGALGDFEGGAVAAVAGARFSAVSGGALSLACFVVVGLAMPPLRRYRQGLHQAPR